LRSTLFLSFPLLYCFPPIYLDPSFYSVALSRFETSPKQPEPLLYLNLPLNPLHPLPLVLLFVFLACKACFVTMSTPFLSRIRCSWAFRQFWSSSTIIFSMSLVSSITTTMWSYLEVKVCSTFSTILLASTFSSWALMSLTRAKSLPKYLAIVSCPVIASSSCCLLNDWIFTFLILPELPYPTLKISYAYLVVLAFDIFWNILIVTHWCSNILGLQSNLFFSRYPFFDGSLNPILTISSTSWKPIMAFKYRKVACHHASCSHIHTVTLSTTSTWCALRLLSDPFQVTLILIPLGWCKQNVKRKGDKVDDWEFRCIFISY